MAYTHIYKIADRIIEITSIYDEVHILCSDYWHIGIPDFSVVISPRDIDFERSKTKEIAPDGGVNTKGYSDSYLETLAVYRKISEKMIEYDTMLFHGSVIAVDGAGYMFTAKSGTGKSTHARLWREYLQNRAVMVNDDKPLLRISDNVVTAYGTPWNGKHRLGNNISVPLKAICILNRGRENHIEQISKSSSYPILLQQVYRAQDSQKMVKTFELLDKLVKNTEFFKLECNMNVEAAKLAYNAMKG